MAKRRVAGHYLQVNSRSRQNKAVARTPVWPRPLQFTAACLVCAGLFAWLQWGTQDVCCGDFDGYYHIKWSRLLWEGLRAGHLPQFKWLPLTSLNSDHYADQHFLFHLLLIPFTWFGDLTAGAKISAVLFAGLAAGLALQQAGVIKADVDVKKTVEDLIDDRWVAVTN